MELGMRLISADEREWECGCECECAARETKMFLNRNRIHQLIKNWYLVSSSAILLIRIPSTKKSIR